MDDEIPAGDSSYCRSKCRRARDREFVTAWGRFILVNCRADGKKLTSCNLMNARDKPVRVVMKIDPGIESESIPKGESFDLGRKRFCFRHRRIVYQNRNKGNAMLQGGRYLEPNKIRRIINATAGLIIFSQPLRSDDGHHNLGALQRLFDVLSKIYTVGDRIEIHEDTAFAKLGLQPIVKAPGNGLESWRR